MITSNERLKSYFSSQKIRQDEIATRIQSTQSYVSQIFSGKKQLTHNIVARLKEAFPDINSEWLLTGKGEMLRNPSAEDAPPALAVSQHNGLPLIPIDALAGMSLDGDYQIDKHSIETYFVIPEFKRAKPDYLIRVSGQSMYPRYSNGDLIACKFIQMNDFIQWGLPHVLDTTQGVMLKKITKAHKEGYWTLLSENPDFQPFDIPIASVRSVSLVVGLIKQE